MKPFFSSSKLRALSVLAVQLLLLSQSHAVLDVNVNGMSDLWEKQYNNGNLFPNTFLITADPDNDGWNNLTQAAAGTDPFSSTSPNGFVTTDLIPSLTYGAYALEWPTTIGKSYQVQYSFNLTPWSNLGTPIIATTTIHSIGINATQPDTTVPPKLFWRVTITDVDSDGDGLTNAEEFTLDLNTSTATTINGISDKWLATHFAAILQTTGVTGINMNADTDNDGRTNLEEYLDDTNPNAVDAPSAQQWVIVKGDGAQNQAATRIKQLTIPAGRTVLLVVAIASEEYPYFTEPDEIEEFNDLVTWNVEPAGQPAITGEVYVNERHGDWIIADVNNQTLSGLPGPVHYEKIKTITAPANSSLLIDVEISATNIADSTLPSYIAVGVLPLEIVSPQIGIDGKEINGALSAPSELKISKMEQALTILKNAGEIVKKELNIDQDIDRFYVRILGGAHLGQNHNISVGIKSDSNPAEEYNDDSTEIDLHVRGADMLSKSLMLTSDNSDDDYAGLIEIGADDVNNDRTHLVQLGGIVKLSNLTLNGDNYLIDFSKEIKLNKKVLVNFVVLDDGIVNVQEIKDTITRDILTANERFAQVGIKIVKASEVVKPVPAGLSLTNNILRVDTPESSKILSTDAKTIITQCGTVGNVIDIHVVYVPYILKGGLSVGIDGITFNSYFDKVEDAAYLSNIFMTKALWSSTLAHELTHILTEKGHVMVGDFVENPAYIEKVRTNLMGDNPTTTGGIIESKRLFKSQQDLMQQSPHAINP